MQKPCFRCPVVNELPEVQEKLVQALRATDANSAVPQPKLALFGFTRVYLKHGESSQVTVEVPAERLRYWDTQMKQYVVEPGNYEFLIGAASDDIRLKLQLTITGG